jgi:nucleoside-triphosphatase THEP1
MEKPKRIYILCGPVHSGKTTALASWLNRQEQVAGILTPDADGKRMLRDIATGKTLAFECADSDDAEVVSVGKYVFSKRVFDFAHKCLHDLNGKHEGWIVLDEIGKLELEDRGFEPALSRLINEHRQRNTKLMLIVRDYLLEQVIAKYNLDGASIIRPDAAGQYKINV